MRSGGIVRAKAPVVRKLRLSGFHAPLTHTHQPVSVPQVVAGSDPAVEAVAEMRQRYPGLEPGPPAIIDACRDALLRPAHQLQPKRRPK